ncbi:hypothetical protein ACVWVY_000052 [Bradyrhizobium sp. URHC0002]
MNPGISTRIHCRTPRRRGTQYAAASRLNHCGLWNTGSPAFAGDDSHRYSRGAFRPGSCQPLRPIKRAQGMPGACCTRGLACKRWCEMRTRAYRYSRSTPAFPAQWSYGLCRALPGEEFLFASVIDELTVLRARSGSQRLRRFDASHGRQDHTVLPYASVPLVCRAADRSQAKARPAIPQRSGRCRVHRIPCPTSVTIAIRPSWRAGNGRSSRTDLGLARRGLFLQRGLDRANHVDWPGEIRLFALCAAGHAGPRP